MSAQAASRSSRITMDLSAAEHRDEAFEFEGRSSLCNPRTDDTRGRRAQIRSSAGPRMERPSRAGHDPRRRVRLERLRLPQPFAGRQSDHRHELERTPLLRVEAVRTGACNRKRNITPRPIRPVQRRPVIGAGRRQPLGKLTRLLGLRGEAGMSRKGGLRSSSASIGTAWLRLFGCSRLRPFLQA